jgi:hypothetical protein
MHALFSSEVQWNFRQIAGISILKRQPIRLSSHDTDTLYGRPFAATMLRSAYSKAMPS